MKRLGSILIVGLAGCFTPPEGIRAAEDAVAAAEVAGAEEYLPIEYANVEQLLVTAQWELAHQDSLSIYERNYRYANHLFTQAKTEALKLMKKTIARRAEVERMIVPEMQMLMVSVQQIEAAGLYEIDALDRVIDDAAQAYREGEFIKALIIIRDAQAEADQILHAGNELVPAV
jgi:hypothetical protein